MKTISMLGLAVMLVLGFAATTAAEEMTLNGTIMCAKCKLKKVDADKCQDVLVVTEGDQKTEYYLAKSAAANSAGHQCTTEMKATVTGDVTEKDGKKWITASKIVKAD